MPKGPKGEKRPADVIGAAVKVMRSTTGEIEEETNGKEYARKGGKADAIMAAVKTGVITDLVLGEADAQHIAARLDERCATLPASTEDNKQRAV